MKIIASRKLVLTFSCILLLINAILTIRVEGEEAMETVIPSKAIPVTNSLLQKNEKTIDNEKKELELVTPRFAQKEEQMIVTQETPGNQMKNMIQNDIQFFTGRMSPISDKNEKIKALTEGKTRLAKEQKEISDKIMKNMKELLVAKEAAIQLNQILAIYDTKLRKAEGAQMKLADEILLKKILTSKLIKEMQGFRVSPTEFPELDRVNPDDIQNVINKIKKSP